MRLVELEVPEKGTYVAVKFSDQTISNLRAYQGENEVPHPLGPTHFHCTLVYSRLPIEWDTEDDLNIEAKPKALHVWDTQSDTRCLVLELSSDYLQDRFDQAIALGATHDHDEYKPHVTLSYNVGDLDPTKLALPTFNLEIVREYKEVLRDRS